MSRAESLRAELAVAELEAELVRVKDEGPADELARVKDELRYARWVQRGGPEQEIAALGEAGVHTNRACEAHYQRWLAGQEG